MDWLYILIGFLLIVNTLTSQVLLNEKAKNFSLFDLNGNLIDTSKISNITILYLFFHHQTLSIKKFSCIAMFYGEDIRRKILKL